MYRRLLRDLPAGPAGFFLPNSSKFDLHFFVSDLTIAPPAMNPVLGTRTLSVQSQTIRSDSR